MREFLYKTFNNNNSYIELYLVQIYKLARVILRRGEGLTTTRLLGSRNVLVFARM